MTVVFADITGSTGLGERLDPESLRSIMGRWFEAMPKADECTVCGSPVKPKPWKKA